MRAVLSEALIVKIKHASMDGIVNIWFVHPATIGWIYRKLGKHIHSPQMIGFLLKSSLLPSQYVNQYVNISKWKCFQMMYLYDFS